ncbi:MAG TPA: sialidase family protein [Acidimicrobiales bacterium]|nr:sialidase family protein [Acidimicrobiales bacterium]
MGVGRRLLVLAVAIAAALPLASAPTPARAAQTVDGLHQTYQGGRLRGRSAAPVAYRDWWFTGTPADQVTKVAGAPTASFARDRPTGSTPVVQSGAALNTAGGQTTPGSPTVVSWRGAYRGVIDGDVELRWFWTSVNPVSQVGAVVEVTFFADPDPLPGIPAEVIGQKRVRVAAGPTPTFNTSVVPVSGKVQHTLVVQARMVYVDVSTELRTVYGSADYPAEFRVPPPGLTGAAGARPYSVEVPARGPVLGVQAAYIGRDATEPTIGVARDNTAYFAALAGGDGVTKVMRSTDGGREWESVSPTLPDGQTNDPPGTADPYVFVDATTGRVFSVDLYAGCSHMLFSDDRGSTWTRAPLACGKPANDHQTIWAGPPPKGVTTRGYPNMVYYCASQVIDADCGRSFDGGRTWEPTPSLAFVGLDQEAGGLCAGYHGHVRVDRDGRIYLPKGHCGFPWVAVSEDAGSTWKQVKVSDRVKAAGYHTNLATDDEGNVFYVWWDEDYKLPWLSVSRDHGNHWSEPLMIAPPGVQAVNFPSIAAGNAGRIAINFPGSTSKVADPYRPWNSYLVISTNALDRAPVFQSTTANPLSDPIHRGDCDSRCGAMLDFMEIVISSAGEAWASATDTCGEDCAARMSGAIPPGGTVATSADGVAVRQLCGPALRGPARALRGPGCR